mmetsp:Transcript_22800/g.49973  ORF Transcript_22800/g.49973 Transcript_22800/m.49973 type:complete len:84 (-) Transcript_22800:15-266(-)
MAERWERLAAQAGDEADVMRSGVRWLRADATDLTSLGELSFHVVLEKNTLDIILSGEMDDQTNKRGRDAVREFHRVLAPGGQR